MEKLSIRKDVGRIHLGDYRPGFPLSGSPGLPWDLVLSEPGSSAFLLILCDPSQPLTDVLFVQSGRISFCFKCPKVLVEMLWLLLAASPNIS